MKHNTLYLLFFWVLCSNSFITLRAHNKEIEPDTVVDNSNSGTSYTITQGDRKWIKNYNKSDTLIYEQSFFKNKPDGRQVTYFSQTGKPSFVRVYKDSMLLLEQNYMQNGNLWKEVHYDSTQVDTIDHKFLLNGLYLENFRDTNIPQITANYKEDYLDGDRTEFYSSGQKKKYVFYKAGHPAGKMIEWYPSGKLKSEQQFTFTLNPAYSKAKVDSSRIKYREMHRHDWCGTGRVYIDPFYKENSSIFTFRHGEQKYYNEDGGLDSCFHYKMDKREGLYTEWYANGNKKTEFTYIDNLQNGSVSEWYENGKLKATYTIRTVFDSSQRRNIARLEGKKITYKPDGNIKRNENYENNQKQGSYIEYFEDENQIKFKAEFDHGAQVGNYVEYSPQGDTIRFYRHDRLLDSLLLKPRKGLEIKISRYNKGGVIRSAQYYRNGIADGLALAYDGLGKKTTLSTYKNGKQNGRYVVWYGNGYVQCEGYYITPEITTKRGAKILKDSVWREYQMDGTLSRMAIYRKGIIVYNEEYYPSGKLQLRQLIFADAPDVSPSGYIHTSYYEDGTLKSEYPEVRKGLLGSNTDINYTLQYYPNGNIKSVENKNAVGNIYGYQLQWDSDGKLTKFTNNTNYDNYVDVTDTALARSFFEKYTHRPAPHGKTVNGKKEGLWVYRFDKEHLQYEEHFKHGFLDGLLTIYYTNGKKMCELDMKNGYFRGKGVIYDLEGNITYQTYLDPEKNASIEYYPNGNKKEQNTRVSDQKLLHETWYENGTPKLKEYIGGEDCMHTGEYKQWYENGQLEESWCSIGCKYQGYFTYYYSNGQKRTEDFYVEGKKQGFSREWYDNTRLKRIGRYINDEKDSVWTYYDDQGNELQREQYSKGYLYTPPKSYCNCVDSTKSGIGFANLLSQFVDLDQVNTWSYKNLHAPLDTAVYKHLFFGGMLHASPFDLLANKPVYLQIPDTSGFKLIVNPCENIAQKVTSLPLSIDYDAKKQMVDATLETKKIAIQFSPALLHVWDKTQLQPARTPDNKKLPGKAYFSCTKIRYNEKDKIEVVDANLLCFDGCEIGNTGVLINFDTATVDLNPEADARGLADDAPATWNAFSKEPQASFVGLYLLKAYITINDKQFDNVDMDARNLFINNHYIEGKIVLPVTRPNPHDYGIVNRPLFFSKESLISMFKQKGIQINQFTYDANTHNISFNFKYERKK